MYQTHLLFYVPICENNIFGSRYRQPHILNFEPKRFSNCVTAEMHERFIEL